jgi:glutaminyl-tRNA synthetase
MPFSKEFWIEREDFMEVPTKGYFRLFPGNTVRLRYGFVVKCIGCDKDAAGNITAVHCEYMPDSKSGTPGQTATRSRATSTGSRQRHAYAAEVRLYDRLFAVRRRARADRDFIADLNPHRRPSSPRNSRRH